LHSRIIGHNPGWYKPRVGRHILAEEKVDYVKTADENVILCQS
jgi:hypothetical protein